MSSTRPRRTRVDSWTVTRPPGHGSSSTGQPNHRDTSSLSVRARHTSSGEAGSSTIRSIIGLRNFSVAHASHPAVYFVQPNGCIVAPKEDERAGTHGDRAERPRRAGLRHLLAAAAGADRGPW